MLGGKLRNFFAKTISSVQISQVTHLTLPASLLTLGSNVFLSSGVITLTFLGQKAPVIQSETFRDVNKLKEIFIPVGATGYEGGGWPAGKVKTGYDVTIGPADHGSASVSSTIASAGTSITLTAEPDAWYHLKEWMTNPEVEVKDNIFTMPESDVTVYSTSKTFAWVKW